MLGRLSLLVTVRPYITFIVLLIITVVLAAGGTLRAPSTEGASVAFLPPGHAIADATREISTGGASHAALWLLPAQSRTHCRVSRQRRNCWGERLLAGQRLSWSQ